MRTVGLILWGVLMLRRVRCAIFIFREGGISFLVSARGVVTDVILAAHPLERRTCSRPEIRV